MFASATVLIRQGQEQEAKLRMTKALKYAHKHLGNHQLVAQVSRHVLCYCRTVTSTVLDTVQYWYCRVRPVASCSQSAPSLWWLVTNIAGKVRLGMVRHCSAHTLCLQDFGGTCQTHASSKVFACKVLTVQVQLG